MSSKSPAPRESVRARAPRLRSSARLLRDALAALRKARALVRGARSDTLIHALTASSVSDDDALLDAAQNQEIAAIARVVRALGRALGARRCLIEALATHELLRARALPGTLRFSVSRDRGTLLAHAWVEAGGRVIIGDGPGMHTPLENARKRRPEVTPA